MKTTIHPNGPRRAMALLLSLVLLLGLMPAAHAAQVNSYHDPAEHWISAIDRTNELDVNAVITHETFLCHVCQQKTSFLLYRTPEYTRDGQTAYSRNIKYSDGTFIGGEGSGVILDGTPGKDAYYTGYHWTKAVCETCGTINANYDVRFYEFGKNIYILNGCYDEFMQDLPETVTYAYADSAYHTKTTVSGSYCNFCYGTHKDVSSVLERHDLETDILPQPANSRFAEVSHCTLCDYSHYGYTGAKSVVADYYGVVDGQPHTVTVSDLSEAGVTTQIRYGNSADACTMTSAPNYTEEGQYTVYYEITYTYRNTDMTENGVAYVWLRDESTKDDGSCSCGCGNPDCGCQDKDCGGNCCNKPCDGHHFVLLDTTKASCQTLGYDRYLCTACGRIEKRDYVNALGHAWQSIVIRDATCETDGKVMEHCSRCGQVKVTATPKGEHDYETHSVPATCTNPGYTVKECTACGDRHITNITQANAHDYKTCIIPASCEEGGKTIHRCGGCGSSFVTDYTSPLGHSWDEGTLVTNATCTGEGVMEYRCVRCGYHRLEGDLANGHVPGTPATCTEPQLCTKCGAVLANALGHDYKEVVTPPTCTEMGYTTKTCSRCGDTGKGDYTDAAGHKPGDWIVDKEPTTNEEGNKHKECTVCGEKLETETLEKLYLAATTDTKGEAVVGGYLVIVTDTDTKNPVANAAVVLNKDNTLSIRFPDNRLLDYADQTTVTVLLTKDKTPVSAMQVAVTDKNGNYCAEKTNAAGQITVPGTAGKTSSSGNATTGWEDADGNRWTLTVKVEDYETGRPIQDAEVSIGKTGNITVVLPKGEDMDENNRIIVTVTDNKKRPQEDVNIIVKGDLGQSASGKTDENGVLIVPEVAETERHGAYIIGYPDGTFGPERRMLRSEAAAIFARLLAEHNGDSITANASTKFADVPVNAWYSGYVRYLSNHGILYGRGSGTFSPDAAITRAEFTTMAVRFFGICGDGNKEIMKQYGGFDDVSNGYWAAEYIKDAAIHGWVEGYGDGTFRAGAPITRAEVVTIVNRLLDRNADADYIAGNLRKLNTFSDVSRRYWAYNAIMEAANAHTAILGDTELWNK